MIAPYVGLMSGTSMDAVDAALVELGPPGFRLLATHRQPYPTSLREALSALVADPDRPAREVWRLDAAVGEAFAESANHLLREARVEPASVAAIGSHGQTVFHDPRGSPAMTVQIGDPTRIAAGTGIPTVADFRRGDVAVGGEGAPLACAFHAVAFRPPIRPRAVVNLGGLANATVLRPGAEDPICGFDTGPANTLLDLWIMSIRGESMDREGNWASTGRIHQELLEILLDDPYFSLPAPKSTGREHFHLRWLRRALDRLPAPPPRAQDVQRTLVELTAVTIARALEPLLPEDGEVLVCGGGASNPLLMAALALQLEPRPVRDTGAAGIHPAWVEASAFAWLARCRMEGRPIDLRSVTGASRPTTLGAIYLP
jgi:anhydro-N-acetylmuramic acid kinase